jgi:hypothetical protein
MEKPQFWWVFQNQDFDEEHDGGFLWTRHVGADGRRRQHWDNLELIKPGDLIFSFYRQAIVAVAVARSHARPDARKRGNPPQMMDGRLLEVEYHDLIKPFAKSRFIEAFMTLLPERHSPFNKDGNGVQGYLFALPEEAGRFLLDQTRMASKVGFPS